MGIGPQVSDSGMDMKYAIRRDAQQAVEAVGSGRMIALPDADAGHLVADALARLLLAFVPLEEQGHLVQRLLLERAGQRAAFLADRALGVGGIDPRDWDP